MYKTCDSSTSVYRIPDCTRVNYNDAEETAAACRLLVSLMKRTADHNMRDVAVADSRAIVRESKTWLERVARTVRTLPCHKRLTALGGYDTLHRLVYHAAPVGTTLAECCMDAFEAGIRGDRRIDETELATALSGSACIADDRPSRWLAATTDRLTRLLGRYSGFNSIPTAQALKTARFLIERNLQSFTPSQGAFKERLCRLCMSRLKNLPDFDTATLKSALNFVRSAKSRFIDETSAFRLETELLHLLTDREDLPAYAREAYTLDLEYLLSDER